MFSDRHSQEFFRIGISFIKHCEHLNQLSILMAFCMVKYFFSMIGTLLVINGKNGLSNIIIRIINQIPFWCYMEPFLFTVYKENIHLNLPYMLRQWKCNIFLSSHTEMSRIAPLLTLTSVSISCFKQSTFHVESPHRPHPSMAGCNI